ncbi:MAG: hypothetical protein M1826_007086 [Phylliscum demangeonii]|nr:MAG: hypothetical protein M1826_007086 [Phylliscum demangeonii]
MWRTDFAEPWGYPGFQGAASGCFVRVNLAPGAGQITYPLARIQGFVDGRRYATEVTVYKQRRLESAGSFLTKAYLAQKRLALNRSWTSADTTEKLRRSGRTARQDGAFARLHVDAKRHLAVTKPDAAAAAQCDVPAPAVKPKLAYGTTLAVLDLPSAPPKRVLSLGMQRSLQIMQEHRIERERKASLAARLAKEHTSSKALAFFRGDRIIALGKFSNFGF